jgi:hypothetical protein
MVEWRDLGNDSKRNSLNIVQEFSLRRGDIRLMCSEEGGIVIPGACFNFVPANSFHECLQPVRKAS